MTTTVPPIDLGGLSYGEYAVFVLTFSQSNDGGKTYTPQNPGTGPFCNATPPGGIEADYSNQLTAQTGGVYHFVPPTNLPGDWTARIYAEDTGQTSRDVIWTVAHTHNP